MTEQFQGLKGLDAIRKSLDARAEGFTQRDGLPELAIKSGEVALIHFLTDVKDIIEVRYHRVPETSPGGKVYSTERLCKRAIGEACDFDQHASQDIRQTTPRWFAWVYVYGILTPNIIEGVPTPKQIQRGARTLNLWELNAPAILRKGEGNNKYLIQQILSQGERLGTFSGKMFEWERAGSTRNDTTYTLGVLPDAIPVPEVELPRSLEDVITLELPLADFPARQRQQAPQQSSEEAQPMSRLMDLLGGKQEGASL